MLQSLFDGAPSVPSDPVAEAAATLRAAACSIGGLTLCDRAIEAKSTGGVEGFQMAYLMQAFLIACNLRRDSGVLGVLLDALRMLFDPGMVATLEDAIRSGQLPVPSAPVLSQMKFVADAAYMRFRPFGQIYAMQRNVT